MTGPAALSNAPNLIKSICRVTGAMKILNWNTQADKHKSVGTTKPKFERIRQLVIGHDADVICLTEALPESMPDGGETVTSNLSGWRHEPRGARKVVLWSRSGWTDVDRGEAYRLPEGRFVSATTTLGGTNLSFVGMCIPWHGYRTHENWGDEKKKNWEGACEYLDILRERVLSRSDLQQKTILLGDFNLQIPPKGYPGKNSIVNQKREATFSGWTIPTAGVSGDPALDKPFIDHVALSPDIRSRPPQFFRRFDTDEAPLSDHNGVCIEIELR